MGANQSNNQEQPRKKIMSPPNVKSNKKSK